MRRRRKSLAVHDQPTHKYILGDPQPIKLESPSWRSILFFLDFLFSSTVMPDKDLRLT